jgi:hypothetical protein
MKKHHEFIIFKKVHPIDRIDLLAKKFEKNTYVLQPCHTSLPPLPRENTEPHLPKIGDEFQLTQLIDDFCSKN